MLLLLNRVANARRRKQNQRRKSFEQINRLLSINTKNREIDKTIKCNSFDKLTRNPRIVENNYCIQPITFEKYGQNPLEVALTDVYLIKRSINQIYPTENDSQLTHHRPTTSTRTFTRNSLRTTSNNDQNKDISHITISNMKHYLHRTNRSSTFRRKIS